MIRIKNSTNRTLLLVGLDQDTRDEWQDATRHAIQPGGEFMVRWTDYDVTIEDAGEDQADEYPKIVGTMKIYDLDRICHAIAQLQAKVGV